MHAFSLRNFLKRETQALHQRVDDAFSQFRLSDDAGLARFLAAQAGALRPLESALEAGPGGGVGRILPDWPDRCRAHLLDRLEMEVPDLRAKPFRSVAQMLGAAYVLEGSRLGARVLLRRVERRDSPIVRLATTFLSHNVEGQRWASFLAALDAFACQECSPEALSGALAAFALFERSALAAGASLTEPHRNRRLLAQAYLQRVSGEAWDNGCIPKAPRPRRSSSVS